MKCQINFKYIAAGACVATASATTTTAANTFEKYGEFSGAKCL